MSSANAYMASGVDNAWSQAEFERRLGVRVTAPAAGAPPDPDTLSFDVVGIDPSLANALRRIMIAELPTVAIEHVYVVDNTSIVACEILAHRLGLVPLALDPALLAPRGPDDPATESNTVVLKLAARCVRHADGRVTGDKVLSGDLTWLPGGSELQDETGCVFKGSQEGRFPGGVRPVHPDILLAKLRPGQAIELEAHCVVGVGREHAKWSPVATAWYRLQPELALAPKAVTGAAADGLAAALPGLVAVEGSGQARHAVLAAPARGHEKLLEKARRLSGEPPYAGALALRWVKDHFVFTVESAGSLPPHVIFTRAIEALEAKCDRLLERL